jgi:hypothetical protein
MEDIKGLNDHILGVDEYDWKESPDWDHINKVVNRFGVHFKEVPATGGDSCAVVISTKKLTSSQAQKAYGNPPDMA